jgi:hypothetical protein
MEQPDDRSVQPPDNEAVRLALQLAWQDHHNARDQTWRALQIEAVLGAGLVTVDAQFRNPASTLATAVLVIFAALFGILISLHHRKLEHRKFVHIKNCEEYLRLHRKDLIPSYDEDKLGGVKLPEKFSFWAVLNPRQQSTSIFILRMHITIMLFAIVVLATRVYLTVHVRP